MRLKNICFPKSPAAHKVKAYNLPHLQLYLHIKKAPTIANTPPHVARASLIAAERRRSNSGFSIEALSQDKAPPSCQASEAKRKPSVLR
jgi:hypothetical protein